MANTYHTLENVSVSGGSDSISLRSIAISMKRIADAMTTPTVSFADALSQPLNNYGETIGQAIQGQIVRGMRGIED